MGSCGPEPQNGSSDIGKLEFRGAEVPEPNGPPGRAAEPLTGTSHASMLLIVSAGTTRDSVPLLPPTVRSWCAGPHAKPRAPRRSPSFGFWCC